MFEADMSVHNSALIHTHTRTRTLPTMNSFANTYFQQIYRLKTWRSMSECLSWCGYASSIDCLHTIQWKPQDSGEAAAAVATAATSRATTRTDKKYSNCYPERLDSSARLARFAGSRQWRDYAHSIRNLYHPHRTPSQSRVATRPNSFAHGHTHTK